VGPHIPFEHVLDLLVFKLEFLKQSLHLLKDSPVDLAVLGNLELFLNTFDLALCFSSEHSINQKRREWELAQLDRVLLKDTDLLALGQGCFN